MAGLQQLSAENDVLRENLTRNQIIAQIRPAPGSLFCQSCEPQEGGTKKAWSVELQADIGMEGANAPPETSAAKIIEVIARSTSHQTHIMLLTNVRLR
jgi:hypothetical protein